MTESMEKKEESREQITIKEVAKLCGVGVSTVSRAINNHPDINEETKRMVMETIRQHNYVPNNSARNLKRSDSNTIAVLIKGITNPFFADMIQVFEREVTSRHYSFVLQHVEEFEDEVDVSLRLEKEKRLKGIVFLGGFSNRTGHKLQHLRVPFVISTVSEDIGEAAATVSVDDEKESGRMVEYLLSSGHEKIALLAATKTDASIGRLRLNGYRQALEKHSIVYDEELVRWTKEGCPTYSMKNGYEQTKELLSSGKKFTCIYAISDSMAIGACKALFDSGLRVPQDYSVAGFDGLEIAHFYEPSITTICQPRREMAEATIRMLFEMIEGKPVEKRQIFEAQLVVGNSTRALT